MRRNGPATNAPAPATPSFIRPGNDAARLYPDPDNVYIATILAYRRGRLVVVRGRAPTFPDTRAGVMITGAEQVRYWSWCTNEYRKPYPVSACVPDEAIPVDANGEFTLVVSTREDRPAHTRPADGVVWLDWGSTKVDVLLLLRHMLAAPGFAESAINLAPGQSATPAMGAYAPRAAYCTAEQYAAGGPESCVP